MTTTIALLLGAGASKPLGIPTTDEMAKEFLQTTKNQELKDIVNSATNDPDIETVITIVRRIKELPKNEGLSLLNDATVIPKFENFSVEFAKTENELTKFIREKCLDPDQEKATENYLSLLKMGDVADVKIFTTNYDKAVENVCNTERIEYSDGFKYSNIDGFPILDPSSFEKGDIRIYKLHGSVDWWSDTTRRKVFRLNLELEGVKNVNNLMIYPAQKDDVFNYPFNILQSILIRTLHDVDEFIVIGHKFADQNIVSAIKVVLEQRSDFKLTIVNPSATKIKKTIFENDVKVNAFDETIETWLPNSIKKYRKICEKKNDAIVDKEIREEKETKDKIIGEYESSRILHTDFSSFAKDLNLVSTTPVTTGIISSIIDSKKCPTCQNEVKSDPLTVGFYCTNCQKTFF